MQTFSASTLEQVIQNLIWGNGTMLRKQRDLGKEVISTTTSPYPTAFNKSIEVDVIIVDWKFFIAINPLAGTIAFATGEVIRMLTPEEQTILALQYGR